MARYKRQINIALDQLDQGLARVYSMVKQGNNKEALYYMDNQLREKYENLQNMISIEPGDPNTKTTGFIR